MARYYTVPAVERAFRILDILMDSRKGLTLAELARVLELPKSSTFVIVETLKRLDVLIEEDGRLQLGIRLVEFGGVAAQRLDLRTIARPVLEELQAETGYTVHLAVLRGPRVLFIDKVDGRGFVRFSSFVGWSAPFFVTSLGKALAAYLPVSAQGELVDLYNREEVPKGAPALRLEDVLSTAERVRGNGYAVEDQEQEPGVRCIGAPILVGPDLPVAAVSVTAIVSQLPADQFEPVGRLVVHAARQIAHRYTAQAATVHA